MSEEKEFEYESLNWIHQARFKHAEENQNFQKLSEEAKKIAERLNLPAAKNLPVVTKEKKKSPED